MFFRYNRRYNILNVEDTFARLLKVEHNGDLEFEFRYGVKQLDVVQRNALMVNVSVISRHVKKKNLLEDSHRGKIDSKKLLHNILKQTHHAKTSLKEQETLLVASRNSDITVKINNELVPLLRSNTQKHLIQGLRKTKLVSRPAGNLKSNNDHRPLLQHIAHVNVQDFATEASSSIETDTKRLMHNMIVKHGVDPSHIEHLTHRSVSAMASHGGLVRFTKAQEHPSSLTTRLLHHHIFSTTAEPDRRTTEHVSDETLVHVVESDFDDGVDVPIRIVLPRSRRRVGGRDNSHFWVKFELIDGRTRATVDMVTKPLDVARHLQLFYTPKRAPKVRATASEISSRVNLEIKQIDRGASGVQVYRKLIHRASTEIDDYVLVGTYHLTHEQHTLLLPVDKPRSSVAIYRVVAVGHLGTRGFDYSNVVVRPPRYVPVKSIALSAHQVETGVEIEARQFPSEAISIQILRRNLTTLEKQATNIGGVLLIDDATRALDKVSIVDELVSDGRVYEYVAKVIFRSGVSELSGNAIIENIKSTPGKVDTRIDDVTVSHDGNEPNVTFTVQTTILDNDLDVILSLLKRQDLKEFFTNELTQERDLMKQLIAHKISRTDLTTGHHESFGVVSNEAFNDVELKKNSAVQSLKYGHSYRYSITPLLRSPETLFERFDKTKTDEVTKKTFKFKPHKFLHPLALRDGVLVTSRGLATKFVKDAMSHGAIGSTVTIDVSFDGDPAKVVDPHAARFDRHINIITWKVEGSIDQIDHFLIMKDVHGVRTIIGKAHSEFEFGNSQFLHRINEHDSGELKYVIVPIFNDYRIGVAGESNSVIVHF